MVRTAARTAGEPTAARFARSGSGGPTRAARGALATTKRRHVDYRRATSTAC
ncbi:hypothetical protein [Kitasatospora sp. NBC_00315]|uniref:hypothetical protein n=1 Tax=Kitasatospora sp. NBC_00315 TaxID=2975963 RepID=UPI0032486A62